jgi:hypothetical protein
MYDARLKGTTKCKKEKKKKESEIKPPTPK